MNSAFGPCSSPRRARARRRSPAGVAVLADGVAQALAGSSRCRGGRRHSPRLLVAVSDHGGDACTTTAHLALSWCGCGCSCDTRVSRAMAAGVAFAACGLHQVAFHRVRAPFVLFLFLNKRWKLTDFWRRLCGQRAVWSCIGASCCAGRACRCRIPSTSASAISSTHYRHDQPGPLGAG